MHRDTKGIVGSLMRVAGGDEVSPDDIADLGFEAEGGSGVPARLASKQSRKYILKQAALPRGWASTAAVP